MLSRFTQRNLLRVYPKGTRVTSSNYKPHIGWMHGAQMVAFNMQVRFKFQCSNKSIIQMNLAGLYSSICFAIFFIM